jgi:ferritin-like metal-binding protein YciE
MLEKWRIEMTGKIEYLADWLRDVHTLEEQVGMLLKGKSAIADQYPELKLCLQTYLEITQKHQITINNCIQRLGEDTSTIKGMAAKVMAIGVGN